MTFSDKQRKPSARSIVLLELTVGIPISAWTPAGPDLPGTHCATMDNDVVSVKCDKLLLDRRASAQEVDELGGWYYDGDRVYVRPQTDSDIHTSVVMPFVLFTFSNYPKVFNGLYYEPALSDVPKLSIRIPRQFEGLGQLGGGGCSILNNNRWFDLLEDWAWESGEANFFWGIDLQEPDGTWVEATREEYVQVGSWRIESWTRKYEQVDFDLVEKKATLEQQLPLRTYAQKDYPGLSKDDVGNPIPYAWGLVLGAKATLLDPQKKRYKLVDHAIFDIVDVRIKSSKKRRLWTTVTKWQQASGKVWRAWLGPDASIENVSWGGPLVWKGGTWNTYFAPTHWTTRGGKLESQSSIAAVEAKPGTFFFDSGWLYLRPKDAHLELSECSVWVESSVDDEIWTTVQPTLVDRALGEFELGEDSTYSGTVSVDFYGKPGADGKPMLNPADIVADVFACVGETGYDADALAAARDYFHTGYSAAGFELCEPAPTVFLNDLTKVSDIMDNLCKFCFAYFFTNGKGAYVFSPFIPQAGAALPRFDELDMVGDPEKSTDTKDIYSKVTVDFAKRDAEGWQDSVTVERVENQIQDAKAVTDPVEVLAPFTKQSDALTYGQRLLVTDAQPETIYTLKLEKVAMLILPGQQFRWRDNVRTEEDYILEALEVEHDLLGNSVTIRACNRRGWYDSFGFWSDDDGTDWNANESYDDKTKRWQNDGYWLGDDRMANPNDPLSFGVSRWW